jgi:hypothetical protein
MRERNLVLLGLGGAVALVTSGVLVTNNIRDRLEADNECYALAERWTRDDDLGKQTKDYAKDNMLSVSECGQLRSDISEIDDVRAAKRARDHYLEAAR